MTGDVTPSCSIDTTRGWSFGHGSEYAREILVYDFIDTSPGQSGSPIMNGYGSDLVGVHTGGSAVMKKNWGTFIDSDKLKWIAESLGGHWGVGEYDDVEVLYDYTGCPS